MQYFQRFRIALTSNSRATSIFSFVLEGEPVILSTINEYMEQLQVDAANTGEQREVRKAKVIADLLTVLSQLSTNPQEVVDPDKVLDQWLVIECLRDTWLGVKAGPVPDLLEETCSNSDPENVEDKNPGKNPHGLDELDQAARNPN